MAIQRSVDIKINTQDAPKKLDELKQKLKQADAQVEGLSKSNDELAATTKRSTSALAQQQAVLKKNGALMQSFGFQAQDAIVQLQMGTAATTVFAQQGSQLLSVVNPMLGLFAAVAGVAGGLLVNAFKDTSEEAENVSERLRQLSDDIVELGQAGQIPRLMRLNDEFEATSEELEKASKKWSELTAEMALNSQMGDMSSGTFERLKKQIQEQSSLVDLLKAKLDGIDAARERELKGAPEIERVGRTRIDQTKRIIEALQDELTLLSSSEASQKSLRAAREGATTAQLSQIKTLEQAIQAAKDQAKADEAILRLREQIAIASINSTSEAANLVAQQRLGTNATAEQRAEVALLTEQLVNLKTAQQEANAVQQRQAALLATMIDPVDSYRERVSDLKTLLERGSITQTAFTAAVEDAREVLRSATSETLSFSEAAREALERVSEDSRDIAGDMHSAISGAFDDAADSMAEFVMSGKSSFSDLINSLIKDLIKLQLKQTLVSGLSGALGGLFSGGSTGSSTTGEIRLGSLDMNAQGGTYSNGIYNTPQMFTSGSRVGVLGESGPEGILPLGRTANGDLGVQVAGGSTGSSGTNVTVNNYASSDTQANVSTQTDSKGMERLVVDIVRKNTASGEFDGVQNTRFGNRRRGG